MDTSVLSRILECIVFHDNIYPSLQCPPPGLSFSDQFAFQSTASTTCALIHLFHTISTLLESNPYVIVFAILLACGLGLPIPEDITLFAAGMMAYYGNASVVPMIVICFFGVLVGDGIIFWLGSKYGPRLTKKGIFAKLLPADRLTHVKSLLAKRGNRLIFAARFMPGLRAPIYFTAGMLHLPFRVFLFYDGLAALLSVPAIILAVYFGGSQLDTIIKYVKRVQGSILIVIGLVIGLVLLKWYMTHRKLKKARR